MKFIAKKMVERVMIVEADSGFDARAFAERNGYEFVGIEPQSAEEPHSEADVCLRWKGSDAGIHPDRHLEIRRRLRTGWTDWARVR